MKPRPITVSEVHSFGVRDVVQVPLGRSGSEGAKVDQRDWDELRSLGVSPNWSLSNGSVVAGGPGRSRVYVARVLMDAKAGERVEYQDGNPLNLCRSNLSVREGFSTRHDRALLTASQSGSSKTA